MYQLVLLIHVLVAMTVIGLVLIQHGKGADIGAAFGSGASNTVFGSQGTGGFLFKLTGVLALIFFATSLTLSAMVGVSYSKKGQEIIPQQTIEVESKMPVPVDDAQ